MPGRVADTAFSHARRKREVVRGPTQAELTKLLKDAAGDLDVKASVDWRSASRRQADVLLDLLEVCAEAPLTTGC